MNLLVPKSLRFRKKIIERQNRGDSGASRGLGRSIALALGKAGANLSLVSRDEKRLLEVTEEARQLGAEAEAFVVDVTNEGQVMNLSRAVTEVGRSKYPEFTWEDLKGYLKDVKYKLEMKRVHKEALIEK